MNAVVHSTETDQAEADLKAPKRVQKRASLHETAVQAVAAGEVQPTPRTRQRRAPAAQSRPSTAVHTHVTVDPRVMKEAKLLTTLGTYTRIQIIDHETVIVR